MERVQYAAWPIRRSASLIATAALLFGCGKGAINLDATVYEPKIVIEAYLYPGARVHDIRISRNFPLQTRVAADTLALPGARVTLTDIATRRRYDLVFDPASGGFEYVGQDLKIEYARAYRLAVTAVIDGRELRASAETTTPAEGFRVLQPVSRLGALPYRHRDDSGFIEFFSITFRRSPGISFYPVSIRALEADSSTFIYPPLNPFADIDTSEVVKDLDELRFRLTWIQDTPVDVGLSGIRIEWFDLHFFGRYRAILYAGDRNFRDFFLTHNQVQDFDGNFREPRLHISGDGIGVFGSAIADTVFFEVLRPQQN